MLKIETFTVNPFFENTYVIYDSDTKEAIVIDPGFFTFQEQEKFNNFLQNNSLTLVDCICTHCHIDHICGANFIYNKFNLAPKIPVGELPLYEQAEAQAVLFQFPLEELPKPEAILREKQKISVGNEMLEIISCPGHSPDHIAFYHRASNQLIAGDILFKGSIGRTDLPGGDYETLITNIRQKLFLLPDETIVFPGHGPTTTIEEERLYNPFVGEVL